MHSSFTTFLNYLISYISKKIASLNMNNVFFLMQHTRCLMRARMARYWQVYNVVRIYVEFFGHFCSWVGVDQANLRNENCLNEQIRRSYILISPVERRLKIPSSIRSRKSLFISFHIFSRQSVLLTNEEKKSSDMRQI